MGMVLPGLDTCGGGLKAQTGWDIGNTGGGFISLWLDYCGQEFLEFNFYISFVWRRLQINWRLTGLGACPIKTFTVTL